jgi:hypothetical protein
MEMETDLLLMSSDSVRLSTPIQLLNQWDYFSLFKDIPVALQ